MSLLLGLPWSAYSTFVLEARHGFNKTSVKTFVGDAAKSALLGLLFIPPLAAAFTAILQRSSPYVGLWLWLFLLAASLFMLTIYPTAIAPLFNTFKPLEEGALRWEVWCCCCGALAGAAWAAAAAAALRSRASLAAPAGGCACWLSR